MSRTKTATQRRAPVEGAIPWYTLVPADSEDAYAFAAQRARSKGYTPVEQGWRYGAAAAGWIMVEHWVMPPQAAGNGQES